MNCPSCRADWGQDSMYGPGSSTVCSLCFVVVRWVDTGAGVAAQVVPMNEYDDDDRAMVAMARNFGMRLDAKRLN